MKKTKMSTFETIVRLESLPQQRKTVDLTQLQKLSSEPSTELLDGKEQAKIYTQKVRAVISDIDGEIREWKFYMKDLRLRIYEMKWLSALSLEEWREGEKEGSWKKGYFGSELHYIRSLHLTRMIEREHYLSKEIKLLKKKKKMIQRRAQQILNKYGETLKMSGWQK
jgi:hypothetical protein